MAAPTSITELSQTAGSNGPDGSSTYPRELDNYQRAHASFIAQLRDGKGFSVPTSIASASTADIGGINSLFIQVTGTTTIDSFGTNYNGPRFLKFSGSVTLTHSAALSLPGAADITTGAGDSFIAVPNFAGNGWNVFAYQRAAGLYAKSGANSDITSLAALTPGGLPDSSVLTNDIADAAITTPKIDNGQVTLDKLATNSVSTTRIIDANVTAAKLDGAQSGSAPIFGARAWVRFNGTGTVAINASGNVSSITDRGTGAYTVNFTTAMADNNFAAVASAGSPTTNTAAYAHWANGVAPTTTSVSIDVITDGGTRQDASYISVVVYR